MKERETLKKLIKLSSIEFLDVLEDGYPSVIAFNAFGLKTGKLKYIVVDL